MRKELIPLEDNELIREYNQRVRSGIAETDWEYERQEEIEAEMEAVAKDKCPWLSGFRICEGGIWCFESVEDSDGWDSQV